MSISDVSYRLPVCRVFQYNGKAAKGVVRAYKSGVRIVTRPSCVQVEPVAPRGEVDGHPVSVVQVPGQDLYVSAAWERRPYGRCVRVFFRSDSCCFVRSASSMWKTASTPGERTPFISS